MNLLQLPIKTMFRKAEIWMLDSRIYIFISLANVSYTKIKCVCVCVFSSYQLSSDLAKVICKI